MIVRPWRRVCATTALTSRRPPFTGRPKSINVAEIRRLLNEGLGPTEVAKRLGIGRASVYRLAGQP